jgi:hypothetical protein
MNRRDFIAGLGSARGLVDCRAGSERGFVAPSPSGPLGQMGAQEGRWRPKGAKGVKVRWGQAVPGSEAMHSATSTGLNIGSAARPSLMASLAVGNFQESLFQVWGLKPPAAHSHLSRSPIMTQKSETLPIVDAWWSN